MSNSGEKGTDGYFGVKIEKLRRKFIIRKIEKPRRNKRIRKRIKGVY